MIRIRIFRCMCGWFIGGMEPLNSVRIRSFYKRAEVFNISIVFECADLPAFSKKGFACISDESEALTGLNSFPAIFSYPSVCTFHVDWCARIYHACRIPRRQITGPISSVFSKTTSRTPRPKAPVAHSCRKLRFISTTTVFIFHTSYPEHLRVLRSL